MEKGYFRVSPSCFTRYGKLDIDGEYPRVACKNFEVKDPVHENYLIFEIGYKENEKGKRFSSICKEIITGATFEVKATKGLNKLTLESKEMGIKAEGLKVSEIFCEPTKVSGLLLHFSENEENKKRYCASLKQMQEEAQYYQRLHDQTVDGPNHRLNAQIKRTFRRTRI